MATLTFTKMCGCLKREGIEQVQNCDSKEEAVEKATKMVDNFNKTFCRKHSFSVVEGSGDEVLIQVDMKNS